MANLLDYHRHDHWVQLMMQEVQRDPPVHHDRVTYQQLLRADQELFRRLSEECRDGIQADPTTATRPLDAAIKIVVMEPGVRMLMMPLQNRSGAPREPRVKPVKPGAVLEPRAKAEAKAKAKAKQADKNNKRKAATELKYGAAVDPEGNQICFAYNTKGKGCSDAACTRKHKCQKCFSTQHPTFKHEVTE
jgi:hypothetical protein